ncbi:hypothetical protein GQ53DRAFT_725211 [Thozetella sp. PMI_491]|nr:hypothetical protein GQ53DRAFT_725211 [Thozetella sp. PMI_491]
MSRTNLGPLTTAFAWPSPCAYIYTNTDVPSSGWMAQECTRKNAQKDAVNCWPPRSGQQSTPNGALNGWGFYSPGISCPIGFRSACTATASGSSDYSFQYALAAGETAVGCCPRFASLLASRIVSGI